VGERKSVSRRGLLAGRKRQMGSGALIRDRTKAVAGSKGTASQLRCKLSSDCACRSENGLLDGCVLSPPQSVTATFALFGVSFSNSHFDSESSCLGLQLK